MKKQNPALALLPIRLHPRQIEFINLECEEKLFGGAAGGGKTFALLAWLAEGVHIPGYNAAIYRRYAVDTEGDESSLKAKSMRLYPHLGGKLVDNRWIFPTGDGSTSSITLNGIAHEASLLSAQGKEFHRVAFDELTHFTLSMYQFVTTTRMRKVVDFPISCGTASSANPGGPGHEFVKEHFISKEAIDAVKALDPGQPTPTGMIFWKDEDKTIAYVPSRAADNPTLDVEDYIKRLSRNKNPVERARMMNGDWGISPEGLIKPNWLRYYRLRGSQDQPIVEPLVSTMDSSGAMIVTDQPIVSFHQQLLLRFVTVDTAGGMKQITAESKGKNPSWTVAMVWDYKRTGPTSQFLFLRHVWRERCGFTEVADALRDINRVWQPGQIKVENATMGPHLVSLLQGQVPISTIPIKIAGMRDNDKVTRATPLLNMLELGQIFLPIHENTWCKMVETEWLGWQGLDGETNDQVDAAAYAAIHLGSFLGNNVNIPIDPRRSISSTPKPSGWF